MMKVGLEHFCLSSFAILFHILLSDIFQKQWPFWNAMEYVRNSTGNGGPSALIKCNLCPYVCSSEKSLRHRRNMLRYHMKGVHGPKTLVCQYCGVKYSKYQPNAFKDHVNAIHLKLKLYKCKVEGCGYTCGYNSR